MTSPGLMKTIRVIDTMGDWCGRVVSYLILPMICIVSWEVFARYALNAPTIWAYDATYMLYGAHFMLGCAYTLLYCGHIRTDMLWEKFSVRKKGLIDAIAYVAFFFPAMIFFFIASVDDAWHAWKLGELSEQTAWRPVLWPFKAVVPISAVLLFIQGISEFIKSLHAARTGQMLSKTESHLV
jgi:TRAP-type mannitol/chloroaromatic compound transport system permease small subunit